MDHQNSNFLCPPKISSFVEMSIGMELVLSLDSLLCPYAMGSGQEQRVSHQGKCLLWVDLQKLSSKLNETRLATTFSTPFLSLMVRLNS